LLTLVTRIIIYDLSEHGDTNVGKAPLTNAEKQARYRAKHLETADSDRERLSLLLSAGTKQRLERVAKWHGHTSISSYIDALAKDEDTRIGDASKKIKKSKKGG
jgi:hypothetical protein